MLFNITEPDEKKQAPDIAVGIDLGTTYSVVAICIHKNVSYIPVDGQTLVPSVFQGQEGVVRSFKRFMPTPSHIIIDNKTPVELSAHLLQRLKTAAENYVGKPISKAVITVPAYFDDTARQATKDAAQLAGLHVLRLINEPTAAALAYGLDENVEGIYAIYDLGGGTFDLSILKMTQGVFQVLGTGGHLTLGGDDIDHAIAEFWCTQNKTLSITPELLLLARQAKESEHFETTVDGITLRLTPADLEKLCAPLVHETIKICESVLKDTGLVIQDIEGVVLVGGSTRLQSVQKAVAVFFQKAPLVNLDPDRVVATGAALQAEGLTHGSDSLLIDVTPLSLGLETMGGIVEKIIPRNTPIPTAIAQEFTTYEDNQTGMSIHIVQGEREMVKNCRSLGQFTLTGIPPLPAGVARVIVTFQVDADGLLTVSAQEKHTGVHQEISVKPTYGLTTDDFQRMVFESQAYGTQDMETRLLTEYTVEAQQIIRYVENALQEDGDLLAPEEQKILTEAVLKLKQSIDEQDRHRIHDQTKELSTLSQPFAELRLNKAIQKQVLGKEVVG